ncbi:hypothetical protein DHEL01_v207616 [Diaporthe helianthi]|uniref:3'-5' exonuclease domain-containing protein n=1 Tax=Diaporthe helianthi TaxID=158607 RepID=A0A2P5HUS4_DIAHE|nr:hypothetical protein DHEL01_v207616 [Diaporthe helianthi]
MEQIFEDRPSPCALFENTSIIQRTRGNPSTWLSVILFQDELNEMIQTIMSQAKTELYMALEGSVLVLNVQPEDDCCYLIDLKAFGATAFENGNAGEIATWETKREQTDDEGISLAPEESWQQVPPLPSLKAILESNSPSLRKVLFDGRRASKILARRFGVTLRSVEDIQSLELECRVAQPWSHEQQQLPLRDATMPVGPPTRSLRHCLWYDSSLTMREKHLWTWNSMAKGPDGNSDGDDDSEFEGATDFLNVGGVASAGASLQLVKTSKKLPVEEALYCVDQVRYLPQLRQRYLARLRELGQDAASSKTGRRM